MMKNYKADIFGEIESPQNFNELMQLVVDNKKSSTSWNVRNVSYWRGQADISWKIDSSAVRRLKRDTRPVVRESSIQFYEEGLLERARKNLFDFDEHNRRISDFELLAKLQHHGAATRLVDFTKNALVGLFFCCNDASFAEQYGLLLGVHTDIIGGHEDDFDFNFTYKNFIENEELANALMSNAPPAINSRISAQHSILLYSKYCENKYGSIYLGEKSNYYKFIAISPELKKESNYYLTNCFDITRTTMFPDFSGFCDINSVHWGTFAHDRW